MAAERTVSNRILFFSVFIINIVYYGVSESVVWTSPAIPQLEDPDSRFSQLHFDEAWFVSCYFLGQFFGSLISGCFMDTLGRKPTTLLIVLFLLISWALLLVSSSAVMLYSGRIIAGFGLGMSTSLLPVYVAEIADVKTRSTLNSLPLLPRSLGYFTIYALGPLVSYNTLVLVSALAPAVALPLVFLVPESPYFLVAKGRNDRALKVLRTLKHGASEEAIQLEMDIIQKSVKDMKANRRSFGDLFSTRASLRALFISCGLLFFLQTSGAFLIMSTAETLFDLARVTIPTNVCTLMFGGLMLLMGIVCPFVTRRFGYKNPLLISAFGMFFSMTIFGGHLYLIHLEYNLAGLSWIPISSLVAYIAFFCVGFSNNAFAVVGELFAPNVKALGTSLGNCIAIACAFLSIQIFYAVKSAFGVHFGIWIFSLTNFFAIPFMYFFVPNTSDLSLLEIQELLDRPWFHKKNKVVPIRENYTE